MIHSKSHWNGIRVRPEQLGLTLKKKKKRKRLLICETQNWRGDYRPYEESELFRPVTDSHTCTYMRAHTQTHFSKAYNTCTGKIFVVESTAIKGQFCFYGYVCFED